MRRRRHKLQVSTFPFLAVLLCAMGACCWCCSSWTGERTTPPAPCGAGRAPRRRRDGPGCGSASVRAGAARSTPPAAQQLRRHEHDAEHAQIQSRIAEVQGQTQSVRDQLARAAELPGGTDGEAGAETEDRRRTRPRGGGAKGDSPGGERGDEKRGPIGGIAQEQREEMTADLAQLERTLADLKAAQKRNKRPTPWCRTTASTATAADLCTSSAPAIRSSSTRIGCRCRNRSSGRTHKTRCSAGRSIRRKNCRPAQAPLRSPYLMLLVRPDGVAAITGSRDALHSLKIDSDRSSTGFGRSTSPPTTTPPADGGRRRQAGRGGAVHDAAGGAARWPASSRAMVRRPRRRTRRQWRQWPRRGNRHG